VSTVHRAWNAGSLQCERFTYGGCESNGNNFETQTACEAACRVASEANAVRTLPHQKTCR